MPVGKLSIELALNSAQFSAGLQKAAELTKVSSASMMEAFRGVGGVLAGITSQFGAFGGSIGVQLAGVSRAIAEVARGMKNLEGASGAMKLGLGGLGVLGVGAAAASAGIIAIGIHATEAAAKLVLLSEATGVDIETLQGLSLVAKLTDVDINVLARGVERMARSAGMAFMSPQSTNNAFRLLKISVTDAQGALKPMDQIFESIADKFAKMQDGTFKTMVATQMFGQRIAGELIPVLNRGGEALRYWIELGTQVGAILSEKDAKAALDFQEQLVRLSVITQGVENRIMVGMLPALNQLVDAIVKFVGSGPRVEEFGRTAGAVLTAMAKAALYGGDAVQFWAREFELAGLELQKFADVAAGVPVEAIDKKISDLLGRMASQTEHLKAAITALNTPSTTAAPPPLKGGKPPALTQPAIVPTPAIDYLTAFLDKMKLASEEAMSLATATNVDAAAQVHLKAQIAAANGILSIRSELLKQLKEYTEYVRNAEKLGEANRADEYRVRVRELQGQIDKLDAQHDAIVRAYDTTAVAKFIAETRRAFDQQETQTAEHLSSLRAMSAAVPMGPAAIAGAEVEAKLAPLREKLRDATEALNLSESMDTATKAKLAAVVRELTAELAAETAQLFKEKEATDTIASEKATNAAKLRTAAIKAETAALFESESVRRRVAVESEMAAFKFEHPTAGKEATDAQRDALMRLSDAQHALAVGELAAQLNVRRAYADKVAMLNEVIAKYGENADVAMAAAAREHDAWLETQHALDENAMKVGSLTEGIRGMMNEIALDADNMQAQVLEAFKRGVEGWEAELSKFVVTGRGSMRQFAREVEESFVKLQIKSAVGRIAHTIGLHLPGAKTGPDGSAEHPLYVRLATGTALGPGLGPLSPAAHAGPAIQKAGGVLAGAAEGGVGKAKALGLRLIHTDAAISASKAFRGVMAHVPFPANVILAPIAAAAAFAANVAFAGKLAMGGDVTPGKAYLVGERQPELFIPSMSGRVHPSVPRELGAGHQPHGANIHVQTSISAMDAAGFDRVVRQHAAAVADRIGREIRRQNVM